MHRYPNGYFFHPHHVMPKMHYKHHEKREGPENNEQQKSNNSHMNGQPSAKYALMQPQYFSQPQNIQQQMINVERQLFLLISLIEENNRLLQSLQQVQQRVVTSGGGAVIVRM